MFCCSFHKTSFIVSYISRSRGSYWRRDGRFFYKCWCYRKVNSLELKRSEEECKLLTDKHDFLPSEIGFALQKTRT